PSVHERLARLLPRLMSFPRLRGRKPHRQLIVSTSLDTLMERALVERVRFVRIVACRSQSTFYVNDYRGAAFQPDGVVKASDDRSYSLASPEGVDAFIQGYEGR